MTQHAARLVALSSLALAAACGAPEHAVPPEGEPQVASRRAAALCTDGAPDATDSWRYATYMGAGSAQPSDAYDRADCNDRFTVQIDGVSGRRFQVAAGWNAALPTNDVACGLSFAQVRTFGYRPFRCLPGRPCTGGWQEVGGEVTLKGEWSSTWSTCTLVPADPAQPLPTIGSSSYSSVRVAVRAFVFPLFAIVPQPAWGGLYRDDVVR